MQPEGRIRDHGQRPEGADHQLAEVVAGDVLDHATAGLGHHTVGAHERDPDQQVAGGPGGHPAGAAGVGRQDAADAAAGHGLVECEPLAALADDGLDVAEPCACLCGHDQVARGVVEHAIERAQVEQDVDAGGGQSPGELGAAAARDHAQPVGRGRAEHLGHLLGVGGTCHQAR